jgi:hypothetical protein
MNGSPGPYIRMAKSFSMFRTCCRKAHEWRLCRSTRRWRLHPVRADNDLTMVPGLIIENWSTM